MNDNPLELLYQQLIIDHSRQPHNFGQLAQPSLQLEAFNPLCGDRFTIYLLLTTDGEQDAPNNDQRIIEDIKFHGSGCAISTASASLMTDLVKGKTVRQGLALVGQLQQLVTTGETTAVIDPNFSLNLGKASALAGVRAFPMRVKCATLSWHALRQLLTGKVDE